MSLSHLVQIKWPVYSALSYRTWAQRAGVWAQVNVRESLLLPGEMWHRWMNRESDITASSFILIFFLHKSLTQKVSEKRSAHTPLVSPPCHTEVTGCSVVGCRQEDKYVCMYVCMCSLKKKSWSKDIIWNTAKQMNKLLCVRFLYGNTVSLEDCIKCSFNLSHILLHN